MDAWTSTGAACLVLLSICAGTSATAAPSFEPANAARGKTLADSCLPCHGILNTLAGDPPIHSPKLAGQRAEALFFALLDYQSGARASAIMGPLVANLSVQDMRDLSAYLAAEGPRVPPPVVGEGSWAHDKVHRDCTACHGETGMGEMWGMPVLAGQHADYLIHALNSYRNGTRQNATMGPVAAKLAPGEIEQLAEYFANHRSLRHSLPRPLADTPEAVAATFDMADIPAGRYTMGTDPKVSFQNGFPPHTVNVPAFRMSRYPVTFDQYDAFARATRRPLPPDEGWGRDARPVIRVTWRDAQAFIEWLNGSTGRRFRLPSEAEWEYAGRAGTTTRYWWGDEPNPNYANTANNTGRDEWPYTSPVGSFPPNPFGLYDMAGNIWQFVEDCHHPSYDGAPTDGSAWTGGNCNGRIVRGGGYGGTRRAMQSASRAAMGETFSSAEVGFRVAETPRGP